MRVVARWRLRRNDHVDRRRVAPPYDRPPLSKALLKGDWEPDRIQLRKPDELEAWGSICGSASRLSRSTRRIAQ